MKIKKRKPGFSLKVPQRQELFIRADSREDAIAEYCSRTGAKPEEFEPKKIEQPVEAGESETPEELAFELEGEGFEVPALEAQLIEPEGSE